MTTFGRRTLIAGLILPIATVWAAEQEVSFSAFAFNGGTLDPTILAKSESDGVARKTKEDVNSTEVEQLLVEVFERDKNATIKQQVIVARLTTRFYLTMLGNGKNQKILDRVVVEFVTMNHEGKPTKKMASSRTLSRKGSQWFVTASDDTKTNEKFTASLHASQRDSLWTISGYLADNPGSPPVPFRPDVNATIVGLAVLLVPGVGEAYGLSVLQNLFTDWGTPKLKELMQSDGLKWGRGDVAQLTAPKPARKGYIEMGKLLWKAA